MLIAVFIGHSAGDICEGCRAQQRFLSQASQVKQKQRYRSIPWMYRSISNQLTEMMGGDQPH